MTTPSKTIKLERWSHSGKPGMVLLPFTKGRPAHNQHRRYAAAQLWPGELSKKRILDMTCKTLRMPVEEAQELGIL